MFGLLYTSNAIAGINHTVLADIFQSCVRFNVPNNVTGVLMHRNNKFMQYIEGDEPVIRELYDKISRDDRHTDCELVMTRNITRRNTEQWVMGIGSLQPKDNQLDYQYINFVMELKHNTFNQDSVDFHNLLIDFATSQ